jgi:hypothetical protein
MKKFTVSFILAISLIIPSLAQDAQLYQRKIDQFNRMKNAGWTMTGIGGGLTVIGTVLLVTTDDSYWNDDEYYNDSDDGMDEAIQAIGGIVCIGVGIGLIAGGVTMGSIGSHKVKSYKNKLNNLSLGMVYNSKQQGFKIIYRF